MGEEQTDISDTEAKALHEVELCLEWLQRAHGHLVQFHHATGHAIDHLDDGESLLREVGHEELADAVRDEYLPRGVIDDRWTYDLLETYERGFLDDFKSFERRTRDEIADGRRHVMERRLEEDWTDRAEE
ncbi:hypothetical protein [Halostella sp. PRR32]|uniref:hypothetical protein n=1 Tax=Halostella sp. PRR32 TaxID=3098147 RepID=UPI002B1DEF6A|nr:hypothetical protein [Halostella sp. PRR32]